MAHSTAARPPLIADVLAARQTVDVLGQQLMSSTAAAAAVRGPLCTCPVTRLPWYRCLPPNVDRQIATHWHSVKLTQLSGTQ